MTMRFDLCSVFTLLNDLACCSPGAVTSPTILPPSTRVSHSIRPLASLPLDVQISQSMPASQSSAAIFEKEKHLKDSCPPLEDCEAEAAASAVAVAAIGNDEVGNGMGNSSTSISASKGFGGADISRITTGNKTFLLFIWLFFLDSAIINV